MERGEGVTVVLERVAKGEPGAAEKLTPLLYTELRALAAVMFKEESPGHTLQPTALVHEAFGRMLGGGPIEAKSKAHFMALAAKIMRQILIDHARARRALKRGGGGTPVALESAAESAAAQQGGGPAVLDILDLHDALGELEKQYPRAARVVELRFFGGMTALEIAGLLGVGDATVERDWSLAQGWLKRRLEAPGGRA